MTRTLKSYKLPQATIDQLAELCAGYGYTQTEVVVLAIDHFTHMMEAQMPEPISLPKHDAPPQMAGQDQHTQR